MSPVRHLNFTGRVRIRTEDVRVRLSAHESPPARFDVQLRLSGYDLPADSRVYLEAYWRTTWQRFCLGTLSPVLEDTGELTEFEDPEGVRFRVKVVDEASREGRSIPGRILARADGVVPDTPLQPARSLLPVRSDDLDGEIWKLEVDDGDGPTLLVDREQVPNRAEFLQSRAFRCLVAPQLLRQVLLAARDGGDTGWEEAMEWEEEGWRQRWLSLARGLAGEAPPADDQDPAEWVDGVVQRFCRKHRIPEHFSEWWGGERA